MLVFFFFFSSRRRHTRCGRDWSSDVCSSDLAVNAFLGRYNFQSNGPDVNAAIAAMLYDMEEGLKADPVNPPGQGPALDMIPTWAAPPAESPRNTNVIVIDAGGTNFRSCLVSFDANGKAEISDMQKTRMIAIDREYGKKEFFD